MGIENRTDVENGSVAYRRHQESKVRAYTRKITTKVAEQFPVTRPLPVWLLFLVYFILGLLFWLALFSTTNFPTPVPESEMISQPTTFNSDNAYEYVRHLAVEIGIRVSGTKQNDQAAVYIKQQVEEIIRHKSPDVDIEYRHENVTGITQDFGSATTYLGVQNIVVKLQPKNVDQELNYILLNSHFDTVPNSPGAGDDGTMVAIMLELMRVFSKANMVRHPIVFLFNGCEECGYLAAHAFVTQDIWMPKIGVLLNLEVAGGGGKEMIFRANPLHPWLMNSYSKSVPNPYANVIAEELYGGGFIQSGTDFAIFKRLAPKVPAIDFAHVKSCYTYHTRHDDINIISKGSLQHTGDNMVALIKDLDTRNELDDYIKAAKGGASDHVFFDYLGWFFVFYKELIGTIINSVLFGVVTIIIAFSLFLIKQKQGVSSLTIGKEYGIAFVIQLLSMALGFAAILFLAWLFDACGRSMTWYYNSWLIFGLYFCPFNFFNMLLPYLYIRYREKQKKEELTTSYYTQLAIHAQCNIICVILIIMTAYQIKSAYLVLLSTIFYFVTTFLNVIIGLFAKGDKWLYLHCLGQILPTLYYFYTYIQVMEPMIPIGAQAFNGSHTNPEIFVAVLTALFAILSTGFYAPIFILFKHRKYILGLFASIFVIFIILAVTPLGFPFKENVAPQRFTVWHTKRDFHDFTGRKVKSDAGYYVIGYDRHGPSTIDGLVDRFKDGIRGDEWCQEDFLCGLPWMFFAFMANSGYNYWIPAEDPPLSELQPYCKLLDVLPLDGSKKKYNFVYAGPLQMNVAISPMPGVKLVKWSVTDTVRPADIWNGRAIYMIATTHGSGDEAFKEFRFNLTFEIPDHVTAPYYFDLNFSAHHVGDESVKSPEFIAFTEDFPKWTDVQNWTSYFANYQFR